MRTEKTRSVETSTVDCQRVCMGGLLAPSVSVRCASTMHHMALLALIATQCTPTPMRERLIHLPWKSAMRCRAHRRIFSVRGAMRGQEGASHIVEHHAEHLSVDTIEAYAEQVPSSTDKSLRVSAIVPSSPLCVHGARSIGQPSMIRHPIGCIEIRAERGTREYTASRTTYWHCMRLTQRMGVMRPGMHFAPLERAQADVSIS